MHSGGMHGRSTRAASETDPTSHWHMYIVIVLIIIKEKPYLSILDASPSALLLFPANIWRLLTCMNWHRHEPYLYRGIRAGIASTVIERRTTVY